MSKQKLKKIVKELKGASKMHAGQAKKLNGMLSKGPFKLRDVNSPMKCWKKYKQVGYKNKGGRRVPDCVKR